MKKSNSRNSAESSQFLADLPPDPNAAFEQISRHYSGRMTALVQSRISPAVRQRFDAEDVVQSAMRDLFTGLTGGAIQFPTHGSLWPLLAQITLYKLYRLSEHHHRLRRQVTNQVRSDGLEIADRKEQVDALLADELDWLSRQLSEQAFQSVEMVLQGWSHTEIAAQQSCSARTVRRHLAEARAVLRSHYPEFLDHRSASRDHVRTPNKGRNSDKAQHPNQALHWNDYVLRRMLGAGRFGRVYLATQKSTQQSVAIKFLRKRWRQNPAAVAQFDREVEQLAKLNLTGVVSCHGSGEVPGRGRFLVMDCLSGLTLADLLARPNRCGDDWHKPFIDLAETLDQIHRLGVVHCDLKPNNILIDADGNWVISDFGFSAAVEAKSMSFIQGTPAYMSAEQWDPFFGPIGSWTDVYALGVILVEIITGIPRFESHQSDAIMRLVTSSDGTEVAELLADYLSTEAISFVQQMFARRVADRIPAAQDVADWLRNHY